MSHYTEEYYSVYVETFRRARKEHVCCACEETIAAGHRYCYVAVVFDREARAYKRCLKCQALHTHLRDLGVRVDAWPREDLGCGLRYEDEWGPLPPEIAALAFMTADEAQQKLPSEKA